MNWIVLDLEAITGKEGNEVLEVGACKLEEVNSTLVLTDKFTTLVHPILHKKVPKRITKLTHISTEMVRESPCFDVVWGQFKEFCGDSFTIFAWGKSDKVWFKENSRRLCLPYEWMTMSYIDLQKRYKGMCSMKNVPGLEWAVLNEGMEFDEQKQHRALEDAIQCSRVLQKVYEKKGGVIV